MKPITVEITVNKDNEVSLYLNTNGAGFDATETAVWAIIAELRRKIIKKKDCPFYNKDLDKPESKE